MEPLGAISELNWNFSDEPEVTMAQLLGAYPHMNVQDQEPSLGIDPLFWSDHGASYYSLMDDLTSYFTDASNPSASNFFLPTSEFQSYELGEPNEARTDSMNYIASEEQMSCSCLKLAADYQTEDLMFSKEDENGSSDNIMDTMADAIAVAGENSQSKRKFLEPESEIPAESPRKKARTVAQVRL